MTTREIENEVLRVETLDNRLVIQRLRKSLSHHPRDAIRWVDLSRSYMALGQVDKAYRAMRVALDLAPTNRFVLRSGTALFVEMKEPDRALGILERHTIAFEDPWVSAAVVAVRHLSGVKQAGLRRVQHLLEDSRFSPFHLAELGAAVGSVEFTNGAHRRARRLLRRSLSAPTENALAQVEWLGQKHDEVLVGEFPPAVKLPFEAEARRADGEARWFDGLESSRLWLQDQPFSAEAAIFATYCACEVEKWNIAIELGNASLEVHLGNSALLNNYAFALVSVGRFAEAIGILKRARLAKMDRNPRANAATESLLLFRLGRIELGRGRYNAVISAFMRRQEKEHAAKAALLLAREEYLASTDLADRAWSRALDLVAKADNPRSRALCESVSRVRLEGAAVEPPWRRAGSVTTPEALMSEPPELD